MKNIYKNILTEYTGFIKNISKALSSLDETIELSNIGIKIIYVLDFSEVHRFAFRTRFKTEHINTIDEFKLFERQRERIASSILFNYYNNLFLLPPHSAELNKSLREIEIENDLFINSNDQNGFENINNILNEEEQKNVKLFSTKLEHNELLNSSEKHILIDIIENKFLNIKYLETTSKYKGIEKIQFLFREKILNNFDSLIFNFQIDENYYKKEAIKIFDRIFQPKSPMEKAFPFYLDALAAIYLKDINENSDTLFRDRAIVIFVSNAQRFINTIDQEFYKEINGRKFKLTRNLDSFLLLHLFSIWQQSGDIASLNFLRTTIKNLEETINSNLIEISDDRSLYNADNIDYINRITDEVRSLQVLLRNEENRMLFIAETSKMPVTGKLIELEVAEFKEIINLFSQISEKNPSLSEIVNQHRRQAAKDINEKNISLLNILRSFSFRQYINDFNTYLSNQTIVLPNIRGELPELKFTNVNMIAFFKSIKGEFRALDTDINTFLNDISNKYKVTNSSDFILFKAYIEAYLNNWTKALEYIDSGLDTYNTKRLKEFYFFKILLLRKLENYEVGLRLCKKYIEEFPDDSRLLREFAVLIWQSYNHQSHKDVIKKSEELKFEISRKSAIEYATKARQNSESLFQEIQILNTLSYFFADSTDLSDIKISEKYFNELKELMKELKENEQKYWLARFFDTEGFILVKKIKLNPNLSKEDKINIVSIAITKFTEALTSKELLFNEERIVQNHLIEAKNLFYDLSFNESLDS